MKIHTDQRRSSGRQIAVFAVVAALAVTAVPTAASAVVETPESRAQALLAQMTLDEKIDMLEGESSNYYGFYNAPIERLGIPALTMADGPAGVRIANPDVNEKKATALPSPLALAATFSTEAALAYGDLIGDEAFKTTHNVSLGTAVDIARVGQAGRAFEGYGEDPLVSGTIAATQLNGIQQHPVMGDIKHYTAYNQEEDRLIGGNAVVSERALQEIYVRPFAIGIEASNPGTAMCSFNKVNFVYACENDEILNGILRDQIGFQGFVMSDYAATHSTVEALRAGLDQEQPSFGFFDKLKDAVTSGQVAESEIDVRVLRVLTAMLRFGLFENPAVEQEFDEAGHALVSQDIAEQAAVLLKNEGGALPLDKAELDSIAVIGADADYAPAGGGSSTVLPTSIISPLQAITDFATDSTVEHVRGTDFITPSSLLPGLDAIPSDYLRSADGSAGVNLQLFDPDGNATQTEKLQDITINGGFFYFEGFNTQSPLLPKLPGTGIGAATLTTTLTPPVSGTYGLELLTSGTTTVTLDGEAILQTGATRLQSESLSLDLIGGQEYAVAVDYAFDVPSAGVDFGPQLKLGWTKPEGVLDPQAQAAADLAAASDVAIVVARDYASEGGDEAGLGLPNGQETMINAVKAANPNTIVVLTTSGSTTTSSWEDGVPAILESWYGGQNQGAAIANLLFGEASPSGKLPVTFPVSEDQTPTSSPEQYPGIGLDSFYTEDVFVGYRGYEEFGIDPQYEFGHGLSYTTFEYSDLEVNSPGKGSHDEDSDDKDSHDKDSREEDSNESGTPDNGTISVTFTVTNTGDRSGVESPQVYVGSLPTDVVSTAPKQLAGFDKVSLEPGESKSVTVELDRDSYSYWDSYVDSWITPEGKLDVMVGASSQDIRLSDRVWVKSGDEENASGISTDAVYTIVNENSGACLDAENYGTANGTAVQQWACPAPGTNAEWTLSEGKHDSYRITNVNAGLVLQVADGSTDEGAQLQLWEASDSKRDTSQSFELERVGDGFYQLVNRTSGLCAAVDGGTRDNGARIIQQSCDEGSAAQSFALKVQGV